MIFHVYLCRCFAHMKISMVMISMNMEVWNSHTSTIQCAILTPTVTSTDVASDTWLETLSLKWTFKANK